MWSVNDQPLQEHPCNLLLYSFRVGFGEQVQKTATKVVRVTVRIPKLVCDRVEEQVPKNLLCYKSQSNLYFIVHIDNYLFNIIYKELSLTALHNQSRQ